MKAKKLTKETIGALGMSKLKFPDFGIGDTIAIAQRIKEIVKDPKDSKGQGTLKERTQIFEGDVIGIHNNRASSTFTIRKIGAHGVSIERIMPYYSPLIESIKIVKRGDVRRAKLYYVRKRVGKAARLKEKIMSKESIKAESAMNTELE